MRLKVPWKNSQDKGMEQGAVVCRGGGIGAETWHKRRSQPCGYLGRRMCRGSRAGVCSAPCVQWTVKSPGMGWGSLRGMVGKEAWLTRSHQTLQTVVRTWDVILSLPSDLGASNEDSSLGGGSEWGAPVAAHDSAVDWMWLAEGSMTPTFFFFLIIIIFYIFIF